MGMIELKSDYTKEFYIYAFDKDHTKVYHTYWSDELDDMTTDCFIMEHDTSINAIRQLMNCGWKAHYIEEGEL